MKLMRKIAPLLVAGLFLGTTAAAADLANWKAAFPGADTVIVLGENAATADNIGAVDITGALTVVSTSTTSQPVANAHLIEAAGDDLNIWDDFASVDSTLDDDDLPTLLMEGTYKESKGTEDNDVTYTQEIEFTAGTNNVTFDQNEDKDADMYLYLDDGEDAYTYTLTFDETVNYDNTSPTTVKEDFLMTKLKLLGREYTITDAKDSGSGVDEMTLMAGARQATQNEYATETYTVKDKTYTVEVPVIADNEDETSVVLKVNGESTEEMVEGDTYTLDDGTVIGVVDIMANEGTETGGNDMVTFYIGAEKMWLSEGDDIEMNGDPMDGSTVTFDSADEELDGLTISFEPDDNVYLAAGESWTDPVLGRIKYTFQGLDKNTETFDLSKSEMVLSNNAGKELVLPVVLDEDNSTAVYLGEDLAADQGYKWTTLGGFTINATSGYGGSMAYNDGDLVVANSDIEDLEDIQFVAVSDGDEAHLITIKSIDNADSQITFYDETKGTEKGAFDYWGNTTAQTFDLGFMDISLVINNVTKGITFTDIDEGVTATNLAFDTDLGAKVEIDFDGLQTTFEIIETAEDTNADWGKITYQPNDDVGVADDIEVHVDATDNLKCGDATSCDISASDDDTKVAYDGDGWGAFYKWDTDTYDGATIEYPEEQVIVKAFVSEDLTNIPELGTTSSSSVAPIAIEDTDIADAKTKNIIAIGGSAINKVSAELLGLVYPTYGTDATWQDATGVTGTGKAVVKLMSSPYATGKYAMLVAGWEGTDTQRAAKALKEATPVLSGMTANLDTSTTTVALVA